MRMDEIRRYFPTEFHEWFAYFLHDTGKPIANINVAIAPLEMIEHSNIRITRKELIRIGQAIRQNLTELNALTKGISDNLSLEGLQPQIEQFSLETTISAVLKLVANDAEIKEIDLDYQSPKEQVVVKADSILLRRVIRNIVNNAIEYTPRNGAIWIEITLNNSVAELAVSDTGPGIPEKSMGWLFNPGFRVGGERRVDIDGRGLGLAFARKAMELQRGRISVESKPGQGTKFILEIPLVNQGTESA